MDDRSESRGERATLSAGGALFGKLRALGVDYVFANSGTDFPPVIEGYVEARSRGVALPEPVTVPHESVAVGMAHGYYLMSGRMQAVMLHTNVGLANGVMATINAACGHVPVFLMSGRTPVTEDGRFGSRTVPISWGQEMYDQPALIREAVKWDYELRFPEQIAGLLDRGWAIANSTPRGPVYLSLPREVLCQAVPAEGTDAPSRIAPVATAPESGALAEAARLLAGAQRPLVIAQRGAGSEATFAAFARFVENWALPVSHYWAHHLALPMTHPMHVAWNPAERLAEADVVLVLNALAPWWPDRARPPADARIIHAGPDPIFARTTPVRNFPADVTLAGEADQTIPALIAAMAEAPRDDAALDARRARIAEASRQERRRVEAAAEAGSGTPMTKAWVSLCLGRALGTRRATIFSELGCPMPPTFRDEHNGYFQEPPSGGLGWCLPAALGAQLADRERLIVATMGDGGYMFANPTACHMVAEALGLPVIILVLNNGEWGAVRASVEGLYPDGHAARANEVPMTALRPSPDFTRVAEASRAHAETVRDGADLPAALDRAIRVAVDERRQVLLDIAVAPSVPH